MEKTELFLKEVRNNISINVMKSLSYQILYFMNKKEVIPWTYLSLKLG